MTTAYYKGALHGVFCILFALLGAVAAVAVQSDDAKQMNSVDLTSVGEVCVTLTPTVVMNPADSESLRSHLVEVVRSLGFRVLEACAPTESTVVAHFGLETRKDYGDPQPGRLHAKKEYVVLLLSLGDPGHGDIWSKRFDQLYIPGRIQKIGKSLLERAGHALKKELRRQEAKSGSASGTAG